MLNVPDHVKRALLMFLIGGFIYLAFALWQVPDGRFHICFLDIGQGDAILLQTPENHQILIDGGPKNTVMEELAFLMPFFDRSIDLVVLSHPHADHIDGLVEVLKRYRVGAVLFSGVNDFGGAYDEFLKEIEAQNIRFFVAEKDVDFRFGSVFLDIIYPFDQILLDDFDNLNNSSVAMKIIYGEKKVLLTGDLELEGEKALVSSGYDLRANILKAGHHGSKTASSFAFLDKVKPQTVVIQSGLNNSFKHPHDEALANFEMASVDKIYRNDIDGRVEFIF